MHATLSTADVAASDAFAYWQDQICARFVRLTAQRLDDGPFHGRIGQWPTRDPGERPETPGGRLVTEPTGS